MSPALSLHLLALILASTLAVSASGSMIEIQPPSQDVQTSPESRALVVITPEALEQAVAQNAWVTLSLQAGNFTGLRFKVIPYHGDGFSVELEAFYGVAAVGSAAVRETVGGGARVSFTAISDGRNDALVVSPGVDFYFLNGTAGRAWAEYSSYGHVYILAPNVDVSWVHQFSTHFGFELGVRVGGAVAFTTDRQSLEPRTFLAPELGLFTGVRF